MMIQTRQLTKLYDDQIGCSGITLDIKKGTVFGLLGPNGAGKSTFVKMLIGLIRPTSGTGAIHGSPIGTVEARRLIGYLPELFRYQEWLTAAEVLRFHARLCGLSVREAAAPRMKARFREVLHEVGLEGREHHRLKTFSKGMQQRLGLANAIMMDPELIILDEPSSALDPIGRYEVRTIVERLRKAGKTVFLNTHLLEDVESVCDEVALLHKGRLRAVGPLEQLIHPNTHGSWELHVGGLDEAHLQALAGQAPFPGFTVTIKRMAADGSAVLSATAGSREQIGWLNEMLIRTGFTLYEARPLRGKLEDWFLAMVERKQGDER